MYDRYSHYCVSVSNQSSVCFYFMSREHYVTAHNQNDDCHDATLNKYIYILHKQEGKLAREQPR